MAYNVLKDNIPAQDILYLFRKILDNAVEKIPHHPEEFTRPVKGFSKSIYENVSEEVKVPSILGYVGYNAETNQVFIHASGTSIKNDKVYFPTESILPIVFQMLVMIPWDIVGEGEAAMGDVMGTDSPPNVDMIMQWLFDQVHEKLKELGLNIPPLTGNFSSDNAGFGGDFEGLTLRTLLYNIPVMDISQALYENLKSFVDNIFQDMEIPYTKTIMTGGVSLVYFYSVDDVYYSKIPSIQEIDGSVFKIKAMSYDKDGLVAEQTVLEKTFEPSSCSVILEAFDAGFDQSVVLYSAVELKKGAESVYGTITVIEPGSVDENVKQKITVHIENTGDTDITFFGSPMGIECSNTVNETEVVYVAEDSVIEEVSIGARHYGSGFEFTVKEVIQKGVSNDTNLIYGFRQKSRCRVRGYLVNTGGETLYWDDYKTISLSGHSFNLETNISHIDPASLNQTYTFLEFLANGQSYPLLRPKLKDLNITAAVTATPVGLLARWLPLSNITYAGQTFSLGESFLMGKPQYLRVKMSHWREGESFPTIDSPEAALLPEGTSNIASLHYDVRLRELSLSNLLNSDKITFKTNEVIWFLLDLLVLIPVSIT